mmetsp:Transcript_55918/g.112076  ORF Transcript_55918/g.112076 Transcript_55918/m.112076 type:complete len:373 (-) Transcript_55918:139-1257(-)
MLACVNGGNVRVCSLLEKHGIRGCGVDFVSRHLSSIFTCLQGCSSVPICSWLADRGASINAADGQSGLTPFMLAICRAFEAKEEARGEVQEEIDLAEETLQDLVAGDNDEKIEESRAKIVNLRWDLLGGPWIAEYLKENKNLRAAAWIVRRVSLVTGPITNFGPLHSRDLNFLLGVFPSVVPDLLQVVKEADVDHVGRLGPVLFFTQSVAMRALAGMPELREHIADYAGFTRGRPLRNIREFVKFASSRHWQGIAKNVNSDFVNHLRETALSHLRGTLGTIDTGFFEEYSSMLADEFSAANNQYESWPSDGMSVEIHSSTSRPDLNGAMGVVVSHMPRPTAHHFAVKLRESDGGLATEAIDMELANIWTVEE